MLTCHCPTLSLTVLVDGSLGYSLVKFSQLTLLRLTVHNYTDLPLPDTVSDRVCRWLDRAFSLQRYAVNLLPFTNPQIYSLAIVRHGL